MKVKRVALIAFVVSTPVVGLVLHKLLISEPVRCNALLQERASEAEQKMLMSNSDGGLFLLTKGVEPAQVLFIGYVGPITAEGLRTDMINSGLNKVKVETDGKCVSEGGLEYTVVVGSYSIPQPQDPI